VAVLIVLAQKILAVVVAVGSAHDDMDVVAVVILELREGLAGLVVEFDEDHRAMHAVIKDAVLLHGVKLKLGREVPRYQRQGVEATPERVIRGVAGLYKVSEEEVLKGVRGKENEARKVAMYLVRRCCEQTLGETAQRFGLGSYGAVGWGCHGIRVRMEREKKFRDRIEALVAEICQQKT
jgi:hypothetical protein